MTPPPTRRGIRYRVVVYELDNDGKPPTVMDATATGFIAARTHALTHHIGLFIASQYPA